MLDSVRKEIISLMKKAGYVDEKERTYFLTEKGEIFVNNLV